MVKKDLWKQKREREITEEGKKEREGRHSQRNWEKRKRRQKEQSTREDLEGSGEVQQQATEENLSRRYAWDRTRQKERRNIGKRCHQISWQQSRDLPLSSWRFMRITTANPHRQQFPHFWIQATQRMTQHFKLKLPRYLAIYRFPMYWNWCKQTLWRAWKIIRER